LLILKDGIFLITPAAIEAAACGRACVVIYTDKLTCRAKMSSEKWRDQIGACGPMGRGLGCGDEPIHSY